MRKGGAVAYLVQIVNEAHQIVALKVLHPLPIGPLAEDVSELNVKLGWRPIWTMELSRGIVRGHERWQQWGVERESDMAPVVNRKVSHMCCKSHLMHEAWA